MILGPNIEYHNCFAWEDNYLSHKSPPCINKFPWLVNWQAKIQHSQINPWDPLNLLPYSLAMWEVWEEKGGIIKYKVISDKFPRDSLKNPFNKHTSGIQKKYYGLKIHGFTDLEISFLLVQSHVAHVVFESFVVSFHCFLSISFGAIILDLPYHNCKVNPINLSAL